MRRLFWLLFLPAGLAAQRPAVSPALPRALGRVQDTTISVWLFARPSASLENLSNRVAASGARVRVRSRWLHAISADVPSVALRALLLDRDLRRIQPLGRFKLRPPRPGRPLLEFAPRVAPSPTAPGDTCGFTTGDDPILGPSEMPYRRLHLRPLTDQGIDATGVRIAILDTGFDTANPAFTGITVAAQYDFVFKDDVVRDEAGKEPGGAQFHGTATWSLFAGEVSGRLHGIARGATFLLAKTEDIRTETRVEEDNYVAALEWADSIGVDIVSSSLAYLIFDNGFGYTPSQLNGDVAVTTVAADMAAQRGILVVTAAGNEGPGSRSLWTPADGDSVLAIGAEDSLGAIAFFSSRGPTADGRIKPDFTAPGVAVCVVIGVGRVDRLDGTSFATPLVAASAALLKQVHPTLTPMALRAAFRNSATKRLAPDTIYGWGRPDVSAAAVFPDGVTATAPLPAGGPLPTITPTFTWTVGTVPASATPVTYRLRISRDTTLAAPLVDTVMQAETYNLLRPLTPGTVYWQVDATAATGETGTTGVIGPIVVPPWVTLTALSNPAGTVTDTAQPTFTWNPVNVAAPPGPFTYDLQVQRVETGQYDFGIGGIQDTFFTLPQPLERNTAYRWALVVHAGADTTTVRSQGSFLVVDGGTPTSTLLFQNFPNPFPAAGRDSTCLWFDLATTGMVELDILDLRGNPVRRFVPGPDFPSILPPGRYGRGTAGGGICDPRLMWDGRADNGHRLPAGVYLAKLKAPGLLVFKRIVFRGK
ncbi:MAG TPA: S8 family serine peptidase [Gemmatimonadales bacterium]|jgi:subtilisin family serine protease|nr:S8 family serine peptidase [Gemmatimonadales bacterium]